MGQLAKAAKTAVAPGGTPVSLVDMALARLDDADRQALRDLLADPENWPAPGLAQWLSENLPDGVRAPTPHSIKAWRQRHQIRAVA